MMRRMHIVGGCLALMLLAGCASMSETQALRERQAELHFRLGVDALQKGLLPKAFDELMLADHLRPNRPEVLDTLAYAWRLRGDLARAEALYRRALQLQSRPETHNNYANLLIAMQRYAEAEKQARLALQDPRYPNQHLAWMNLGDAMLAQGQASDALQAYRQAAMLRPRDVQPVVKQAQALMALQQPRQALALLETALQRYPTERLPVQVAMDLFANSHPNAVRKMLRRLISQTQDPLDRAWAEDQLEKLR